MRKLVGGAMVATPFVAWLVVGVVALGWAPVLVVLGGFAVVFALIFAGMELLMDD